MVFGALTWRGWVAMAVAAFVLGVLIVGAANLVHWAERRAADKVETARDEGVARGLEAKGAATIGAATSQTQATAADNRKAIEALNDQAARDPNAQVPLPDSVRARVRAGDERLRGTTPLR
jgi:hypothetical protein